MSTPTLEKRAGHMLDGVIVTLAQLRSRTKVEDVRLELEACIRACEGVQAEFEQLVALAAKIDATGDRIAAGRRRLAQALGVGDDAALPELLDAAADVIQFAAEAQEA